MHNDAQKGLPKEVRKYFPSEALAYVNFYFTTCRFHFKVTRPRLSKKGDFKYFKTKDRLPAITVNGNLCAYDFLLVFIHELAHYMIYRHDDINRVKAHGPEWKRMYKNLLSNLLEQVPLPQDIALAFRNYSNHITSSTIMDAELEKVLDRYRDKPENVFYLKDLEVGEKFVCRNEIFRVESFARTRARCVMEKNSRRYLISGMMNVTKIDAV